MNDHKLLRPTIEAVVVERPDCEQYLSLDKASDNAVGECEALINGYIPHIRRIGEENLDEKGERRYPARRWVVARTIAWLSKCCGLLVRHEKKAANHLGLIQLACALIWFRRYCRLTALG